MSNEESVNSEEGVRSGSSRRAVLKAGVATGVGLVAWSVPSITSLGGTPVYAAGCTFVQVFSLTNGCRNSTQQTGCTGPFSFQPLTTSQAGFSFAYNVGSNVCCESVNTGNPVDPKSAVVTIPNGLECKAVFAGFAKNSPDCSKDGSPTLGSSTTTSVGNQISIPLNCLGLTSVPSSFHYSITLSCNTIGAPASCL